MKFILMIDMKWVHRKGADLVTHKL